MAIDVSALVQRLQEAPEERAALRQVLLGDEPDLTVALTALTDRVGALAAAQERTEQRLEALAAAQERTEQRVEALAVAQERTQ